VYLAWLSVRDVSSGMSLIATSDGKLLWLRWSSMVRQGSCQIILTLFGPGSTLYAMCYSS
jgi:hypothetical protein